jgi:O-methyltransferase
MLDIDQLLSQHPIVSDQVSKAEIRLILQQLETVIKKGVKGAVVEFGCYTGTTSLFVQRLLQARDPNRSFHVYDSFEGLPDKSTLDQSVAGDQFITGELRATKSKFVQHFKQAHLPLPTIHKAWFNELLVEDVPQPIALAFLDGDYYESIKTSLKLITPKLSHGAIIIVDDYQSEALPGTAKAVDEWLQNRAHLPLRIQQSLAIITVD